MDEIENITRAQHAAAILEGRGTTEYIGATKVISVRLPMTLEARVQAFAHKSGKTRNGMIAELLEVGLEEVSKHLEDATLEDINELMVERFNDSVSEHFKEVHGKEV